MKVITLNIILDVEGCAADEKIIPIIRKIKIIGRKEVSELTTSSWICQADCLWSIVTTISIVPVRDASKTRQTILSSDISIGYERDKKES